MEDNTLSARFFDKDTLRRGSNSYKWDEPETDDVIPMWVADMDFEAAPAIKEALQRRVEHGVFGYTMVPESYYTAIQNWFGRRHNWHIDRSHILYTTGVVPALSCALKAMTLPGEQVLVQTPVYNCFFSSIANTGCVMVESELVRTEDSYTINFDDFERKCAEEKTTVFVLCNPHNPAGRVWTPEELERLNAICMKHGVRVISDEIHCELVMPGHRFTPFAAVSAACRDNCVTLNSPSKSFNTAGLQIANIICADPLLRNRINRAVNINEVCDVNPFGPVALEAAYNSSEDWLNELNRYIYANYTLLKQRLEAVAPVHVLRLEGTYLAWVDVSSTGMDGDEFADFLLHKARVMVSSGTVYGKTAGRKYVRINLACPRFRLEEALRRMEEALKGID